MKIDRYHDADAADPLGREREAKARMCDAARPPLGLFDAGKLLAEAPVFRAGPACVLWHQDGHVPNAGPLEYGPLPKGRWLARLLRRRLFAVDCRLVPPPMVGGIPITEEALTEWGHSLAEAIHVKLSDFSQATPESRAVWVSGFKWAPTAAHAIAFTRSTFRQIQEADIRLGSVQIRAVEVVVDDEGNVIPKLKQEDN